MSITYPERRPSTTSQNQGGAAVMDAGSALFPNGSTGVYERNAKARAGKSNLMLWIAAPAAIILVGGAVLLSTGHGGTSSVKTHTVASTAITSTAAPVIATPKPVVTQPAPEPVVTQTHREVETRTTIAAPTVHAKTASHVTRHVTTVSSTSRSTPTPAPQTAVTTPDAAPAPAATPGNFAFTPAAPAETAPAPAPASPSVSAPAPTTAQAPQA